MSNPEISFELVADEAPAAGGTVLTLGAEAYARMLAALLPPGRLWTQALDANLRALFLAIGDELARVGGRAADLLRESDPRTADELLPDFERMLGLSSDGSLEERRGRVVSRLVRRQRYRPADFALALAPVLGLVVEDVQVIERDRADAIAMDDDREIYRFFVYRDPSLPGDYDLDAAQALIDSMKPSHTKGHAIESTSCECDDPHSLCDRDILGV